MHTEVQIVRENVCGIVFRAGWVYPSTRVAIQDSPKGSVWIVDIRTGINPSRTQKMPNAYTPMFTCINYSLGLHSYCKLTFTVSDTRVTETNHHPESSRSMTIELQVNIQFNVQFRLAMQKDISIKKCISFSGTLFKFTMDQRSVCLSDCSSECVINAMADLIDFTILQGKGKCGSFLLDIFQNWINIDLENPYNSLNTVNP